MKPRSFLIQRSNDRCSRSHASQPPLSSGVQTRRSPWCFRRQRHSRSWKLGETSESCTSGSAYSPRIARRTSRNAPRSSSSSRPSLCGVRGCARGWRARARAPRARGAGLLPLDDGGLADAGGGAHLARHGEDHEIRPLAVVGIAADDDGGPAFAGGLVGEGERDEDQVPELIAGHSRRRRGGPRPWRRPPRRACSLPA